LLRADFVDSDSFFENEMAVKPEQSPVDAPDTPRYRRRRRWAHP
jgi:hypothetical protein